MAIKKQERTCPKCGHNLIEIERAGAITGLLVWICENITCGVGEHDVCVLDDGTLVTVRNDGEMLHVDSVDPKDIL